MARFLSPEWLAELDEAARESPVLREATAEADLTVQQVVTGTAQGEVRYTVRLRHGDAGIAEGTIDAPDVTVRQPLDVAVAINRGELDARAALDEGRLRVTGDVRALVAHQATLQRLASVFADVRARTTYD